MKHIGIILSIYLLLFASCAWSDEDHEEHEKKSDEALLSEETLHAKGVTIHLAGPGELARTLKVYGRVSANQNRLANIHPRFPGILKDVNKSTGDLVDKGETLAVIESNQSLQPYQVLSQIPGTVLFRKATIGEYVSESDTIFVVADLSTLWVDLFIFPRDFALIKEGLQVRVRPPHMEEWLESTISFVSRVADDRTQARVARAVLECKGQCLYPDQYVDADIVLETVPVPLAVDASAVQRIADKSVVYVRSDEKIEQREVATGRTDGSLTEILSGLAPGEEYLAGHTFLLKAELGKSSVEDDD